MEKEKIKKISSNNNLKNNEGIVIPLIKAKKTSKNDVILDPKGFFVIEIRDKEIIVEYYTNIYRNNKIVTGKLKKVFSGTNADALCDTISKHIKYMRPEHYMYLGGELIKAQYAIVNNIKYVQGGC